MSFHALYRPKNLDQIIGHEAAVTRLRGMIDKVPNAIAFFGPTSAGKTTLARAFAAAINGLDSIEGSRDYMEVNASEARTIEDVREMLKASKFRPQNKKRVIVVDEAQGILSNAVAANAFLKPLEEPSKDTLWIICSMDPSKFQSGTGKAIANRCSQFVLEPHTQSDMLKQAMRIAKAEKMSYVMGAEKTVLKTVVRNAQEMRTLSNLMESLQQFHTGLKEKPKMLTSEHVTTVLRSTESADDKLAIAVLAAVYQGQFKVVQRSLLDISDTFMFIQKMIYLSAYVLNSAVLDGARHPKVWATVNGKELAAKAKGTALGSLATVHANLIEIKSKAAMFAVDPTDLLSAGLFRTIKEIHTKG